MKVTGEQCILEFRWFILEEMGENTVTDLKRLFILISI